MEDIKIGILIGLNCPNVLRPRDVIYGKENEPYAVNSLLGWYINGPVEHGAADKLSCNRVRVTSPIRVDTPQAYIIPTRSVKECMTPQLVQRMFDSIFQKEKTVLLYREKIKNSLILHEMASVIWKIFTTNYHSLSNMRMFSYPTIAARQCKGLMA